LEPTIEQLTIAAIAVVDEVSVVRLFETDSGVISGRIWRIC